MSSLLLWVGCGPSAAFECASDAACVHATLGAGICQPTGFCSFPDDRCPSGQRYGDLSESLADQCVPPEHADDDDDDDPGDDGGGASETDGGTGSSGDPTADSQSTITSGPDSTMPDTASASVTQGDTEDPSVGGTNDESSSGGGGPDADLALWIGFEDTQDWDGSDYAHPLECSGSCPASGAGMFGSAGTFSNQGLGVPYHPSLDLSGAYTLALWARADGPQALGRGTLFSQPSDGEMVYDLSIQDLDGDSTYDLVAAVEGTGGGLLDVFAVGEWVHIVVVHTPGHHEVFVNGTSRVDSDTLTATSPGTDLYVGRVPGPLAFALNGAVDDLRLYRRVLTDPELATVMRGEPLK